MFTLTPWLGGERVGQGVNVCDEFVGCLPSHLGWVERGWVKV